MAEVLEVVEVTAVCRRAVATRVGQSSGFSCGESCELFQPHLHGAATSLAASDDEDGVVTGDRADDLAPAGAVQCQRERLRRTGRGLEHQQGADAFGGNKHGGQELLQMRADTGRAFGPRRIVRSAVGRGYLGEAQLADVARQRRLRHVESFGLETLAQLLLTAHRISTQDAQDGRVTLRFHWPEIWCTILPLTTVRRAGEDGRGRAKAVEEKTARSAALPTSSEPIS